MSSLSPFTPPPAPGNHSSTLCLWICLFWTFHINGVLHFYGLSWLASFTHCNVFKVHPHCGTCQCFIPSYSWIYSTQNGPYIVYPFVSWWAFRLSPTVTYSVCKFSCAHALSFLLGMYLRVELLALSVNPVFNCVCVRVCVSRSVVSDSLLPHGL